VRVGTFGRSEGSATNRERRRSVSSDDQFAGVPRWLEFHGPNQDGVLIGWTVTRNLDYPVSRRRTARQGPPAKIAVKSDCVPREGSGSSAACAKLPDIPLTVRQVDSLRGRQSSMRGGSISGLVVRQSLRRSGWHSRVRSTRNRTGLDFLDRERASAVDGRLRTQQCCTAGGGLRFCAGV